MKLGFVTAILGDLGFDEVLAFAAAEDRARQSKRFLENFVV